MKNTITILALFIAHLSFSQSASDALRYAILEDLGTARSISIGSAISSLGGDFYTASINPAGLATYRSSEFTITPVFRNNTVTANLNGSSNMESDKSLPLANLGFVVARTNEASKWKTVNFGIGYNRTAKFDNQMHYNGITEGSITDRWIERAEGFALDDLLDYESGLAFDAGAIFDGNEDRSYDSDYDLDGRGLLPKSETVTSDGGMGEMVIALGANLNHKWYLGFAVGVPIVDFQTQRTYRENQPRVLQDDLFFSELVYSENLQQSGAGINAKMGLIYRISQAVRWSAYFHTPTVITLLDEFRNGLTYDYYDSDRNFQTNTVTYPPNGQTLNFEYDVITPYKVGTGLAFIVAKSGFITGEVSYTDYSYTRFEFDPDLSSSDDLAYESELNNEIEETYQGAWTARLGGELALDIFRLRLGTVIKERPYVNDDALDLAYTAGIGLRFEKFFLDVAYKRFEQNSTYLPYVTSERDIHPLQQVKREEVWSDVFVTIGLRF